MEMKGDATLYRMLCQSTRGNPVPADDIKPMLEWMDGKLWIYDILGNVEPGFLMELMEYSYARSGVNMFVIDSLMKCNVAGDDYEAQRLFMNRVCSFAQDTGTHVHIIAHPRKGNSEEDEPGKLDVKGSSDLVNQPDNVLCVYRNKKKEAKARNQEAPAAGEPDTVIKCTKQRETGEDFVSKLRHMPGIYRFSRLDSPDTLDLDIRNRIRYPEDKPESVYDPIPEPSPTQEQEDGRYPT